MAMQICALGARGDSSQVMPDRFGYGAVWRFTGNILIESEMLR